MRVAFAGLAGHRGEIGLGTLTADGELHFTPLPRIRTHRNPSNNGYRWYNDYRLPTTSAPTPSPRVLW